MTSGSAHALDFAQLSNFTRGNPSKRERIDGGELGSPCCARSQLDVD